MNKLHRIYFYFFHDFPVFYFFSNIFLTNLSLFFKIFHYFYLIPHIVSQILYKYYNLLLPMIKSYKNRSYILNTRFFSSIRSRILIYTILIIVLFGTVIGSVVFYAVYSVARNNLVRESETSLLYMASSINSNVESVRSSVQLCQTSQDLAAYALGTDNDDSMIKLKAHDVLQNTYMANSDYRKTIVRAIAIGNNRSDLVQFVEPAFSSSLISKEALMSQPFFNNAILDGNDPSCGILTDPFLKSSVEMIPLVYSIYHPYKSDVIGFIYVEMSANALALPISNSLSSEDSQYYVKMGPKLYIYKDNQFELISDSSLSSEPLSQDGFTTITNKEFGDGFLTISYPLGVNDWYIIKRTNTSAIWDNLYNLFAILLFTVIVFSAFVGLVFHRLLSNMVNNPVKKLTDRIIRIESGDFSRDEETEWNNELGDIGRTINDLTENVYSLMNQRIEDEKQKKDYEYQILQSQINPHFLYNTLNSIKWMATIQNSPGIAEMTTALSRLLKDISKGTNTVISLRHELSLIDDYFTIQSYRYGGTISLTKNIESDDLLDCKILRFTMQPLIENAIFHGIEPKGTSGTISITIYRKDDLFIEVHDDGVGMDEKTVEAFLSDTQKTKSSLFKEIGMDNVNKRLKYEFGEDYGMSIDSVVNEYTNITIRIPYLLESEVPNENINS